MTETAAAGLPIVALLPSLSHAIVKDRLALKATGLFKEALFAERESDGDLILRGEIKSTHFNTKILSYGLSGFASLLWAVGLPVGTVLNEVDVRLAIEDKTTKTVLSENEYRREYDGTHWAYSTSPVLQYDILYTEILKTAIEEMTSQLRKDKSLSVSM